MASPSREGTALSTETTAVQEAPVETPAEGAGTPAKGRFSLKSKKAKIIIGLVGIMALWGVVGYVFLPKPASESKLDEGLDDGSGLATNKGANKVEIELGDGSFSTTNQQAVAGLTSQVRVKIFVTVAETQ